MNIDDNTLIAALRFQSLFPKCTASVASVLDPICVHQRGSFATLKIHANERHGILGGNF